MSTPPVTDVHAHYLPPDAIEVLARAGVPAELTTIDGRSDCIRIGPIDVGATIHQLSDVSSIRRNMEETGLERRVLSPPPFAFQYQADASVAAAGCRALNDATAAVAEHDPERFRAFGILPLQDPDAALAELERIASMGISGIEVGTTVGEENLSAPRLREVFIAIAERDLPVLVHPGFVPNPTWSDYYLANLVGMPVQTGIAVANIVFTGMLDEAPVRFCFVHGGGVSPVLAGRWTKGWRAREALRADQDEEPERHLRRMYFDTLTHSSAALDLVLDVMGPERVVLGTDHPFDVEDPDPRAHLRTAQGLDAAALDTIERHSAEAWLTGRSPQEG